RVWQPLTFAVLVGVAVACSSADPERAPEPAATGASRGPVTLSLTEQPAPAPPGSFGADLASAPDGRVYLSWLEPSGRNRHALRFASSDGSGWSEPRTIATGENWF